MIQFESIDGEITWCDPDIIQVICYANEPGVSAIMFSSAWMIRVRETVENLVRRVGAYIPLVQFGHSSMVDTWINRNCVKALTQAPANESGDVTWIVTGVSGASESVVSSSDPMDVLLLELYPEDALQ